MAHRRVRSPRRDRRKAHIQAVFLLQAQLIQIFPCGPLVQSFFACMFLHPAQETGQYQTILHMHAAHIFLFHWIFDCFCRCRRVHRLDHFHTRIQAPEQTVIDLRLFQ